MSKRIFHQITSSETHTYEVSLKGLARKLNLLYDEDCGSEEAGYHSEYSVSGFVTTDLENDDATLTLIIVDDTEYDPLPREYEDDGFDERNTEFRIVEA